MKKWMNYLPYALVIIILASLIIFSNDSRTENMDYSTFMQEAENMDIQEASISVGTTVIDVQGIYDSDRGTRSFTVSIPNTDENIKWLTETLGGDDATLLVGNNSAFALLTGDDGFHRFVHISLGNPAAPGLDGEQGGFVDDVGQIRAGGAGAGTGHRR